MLLNAERSILGISTARDFGRYPPWNRSWLRDHHANPNTPGSIKSTCSTFCHVHGTQKKAGSCRSCSGLFTIDFEGFLNRKWRVPVFSIMIWWNLIRQFGRAAFLWWGSMVFRTGFVKVHLGGVKPVYISQMLQSHWMFVDDMYEMLLGSFFGVWLVESKVCKARDKHSKSGWCIESWCRP